MLREYTMASGDKRACVTAEECRERNRYAYRNSGECSETEPDLAAGVF